MRQGKEVYSKKHEEAMRLFEEGFHPKEIAEKLGISFSAVYSWTVKGKKPRPGIVEEFEKFIQTNGPTPLIEIAKIFPKHSEIFLMAQRRGIPIARKKLTRNMGEYYIWYYLKGQEKELEERMEAVIKKRIELQEKILEKIDIVNM